MPAINLFTLDLPTSENSATMNWNEGRTSSVNKWDTLTSVNSSMLNPSPTPSTMSAFQDISFEISDVVEECLNLIRAPKNQTLDPIES